MVHIFLKYENLLDADSEQAQRMADTFERNNGGDYDAEQSMNFGQHQDEYRASPYSISGNSMSVFLYPTTEWVNYVKGFGFNGLKNTPDIFIFNKNDLIRVK